MLPNSIHIIIGMVNVILLVFILVRVHRIARYFYIPEQRKLHTKSLPAYDTRRPPSAIPRNHKSRHGRRYYGKHE